MPSSPVLSSGALLSLQMDQEQARPGGGQLSVRNTEAAVSVHRWRCFLTTSSHPAREEAREEAGGSAPKGR